MKLIVEILKFKTTRAIHPSLLLVFLFAFLNLSFQAQDIKATAKLDTNSILIGQQAELELSIEYRADKGNFKILWPTLSDTIVSKVEIVSKTKIDTTIPNKESETYILIQKQTITITSFDSGYYAIPPFKFIVNGDTTKPIETEALLFQVNTVAVDTTLAIKDIKPPFEEPFNWRELVPQVLMWTGILVAIGIIIFLLIRYFKKKPVKIIEEIKPKIPPHITALEELEKLKQEKIWQQGNYKVYHSKLTDILRWYIEKRYNVQALEQTSDEILSGLRYAVIDQESVSRLRKILLLADMVKFAKEQPLATENEIAMEDAIAFINGTKREETVNSTQQSVNS